MKTRDKVIANFAFGFFSALAATELFSPGGQGVMVALANATIQGGLAGAVQMKQQAEFPPKTNGKATAVLASSTVF